MANKQAQNEAPNESTSAAGTGTGSPGADLARLDQADKVFTKINEYVYPGDKEPTKEELLANAQVNEQIRKIQRKGEFAHGLKIGAAWVAGSLVAIFGMTLASAAAMRVSKNKLGVDLEPKPIIITDPGTAQMLIANTSRNA